MTLRYKVKIQYKISRNCLCVPVTDWPGDDCSVLVETAVLVVETGTRRTTVELCVMNIGVVVRSGSRVEVKVLLVVDTIGAVDVGVIEI